MVMGSGKVFRRLREQFSGHPQVDPQPPALPDAKKHLFAMGMRGEKGLPGNSFLHDHDWLTPKNPFSGVQMNGEDSVFQPWIPLFSKKFDFSQLGHGLRLARVFRGASDSWKELSTKALAKESRLGRRAFWAIFRGWQSN